MIKKKILQSHSSVETPKDFFSISTSISNTYIPPLSLPLLLTTPFHLHKNTHLRALNKIHSTSIDANEILYLPDKPTVDLDFEWELGNWE